MYVLVYARGFCENMITHSFFKRKKALLSYYISILISSILYTIAILFHVVQCLVQIM